MNYLQKDAIKNNFLLADIDNDGGKERLQWELAFKPEKYEDSIYQIKLFDDDGSLLWKGSRKDDDDSIVGVWGEDSKLPVVFNDIDGDGNTEVIMWHEPHESPGSMFSIFRWNGKKFTEVKKSKYNTDLVWTDPPNGKVLKWTSSNSKRKKVWLAVHLWQRVKNELPIVDIRGWNKDSYRSFLSQKAKIRFTPTEIFYKVLKINS